MDDTTASKSPAPTPAGPEDLLAQGRLALAAGSADRALEIFAELALHRDYACDADYGLALAYSLQVFSLIDPLVQMAGLLRGLDVADTSTLVVDDYGPVLLEILAPLERAFAKLRPPLQRVIAADCRFLLPEGYPIELGRRGSELYVRAVVGDEWDTAPARLMLFGIDLMQAAIDFVMAHRFTLNTELADDAFRVVQTAFAQSAAKNGTGTTWIVPARSAGVLFDWNPLLLQFSVNSSDRNRIFNVDDDLEAAVGALFRRNDDGSEEGLLIDMMARSLQDDDLDNNVLALEDDGNGAFGTGDTLILGIHTLTLGSIVSPQSDNRGIDTPPVSLINLTLTGNVRLEFQPGLGDVGEAARLAQDILDIIGRQMRAVDDPETQWRRLGLHEFNQIIARIDPFAAAIPQFPEAVELDLRSYFINPVPIRKLLPYWYDADGLSDTPDEFAIEGESAIAVSEPFVTLVDGPHFPDSLRFDTVASANPLVVSGVQIPADLIFPTDKIRIPVPYFAWQDPSFHSVLYVNPSELPISAEGLASFVPATQLLANKLLSGYLVWYSRETGTIIE